MSQVHAQRKDWVTGQAVYGELKSGQLFRCSLGLARRLRDPDCEVGASFVESMGHLYTFDSSNLIVTLECAQYDIAFIIFNFRLEC